MDGKKEFGTSAKFLDPAEAQMAKSALEAEGIESFMQGENANAMIPMAFRARLQVSTDDEAAARESQESAEVIEQDSEEDESE